MSVWNLAYLGMVVTAFVGFMVVLMSVHVGLMLSDAKKARSGADR